MGLAPYGSPRYVSQIYEELIDVKPDGTFRLNLDYFDFPAGLRMINQRFCKLFGGPPGNQNQKLRKKKWILRHHSGGHGRDCPTACANDRGELGKRVSVWPEALR